MKKINIKQVLIGIALLVIGVFLGSVFFGGPGNSMAHEGHEYETVAEVWTCSMHPQVREDGPGSCPFCGMDLIPLSSNEQEAVNMDEIQMTEAAMMMASIQTVSVTKSEPTKQVYLPGKIEADERSIAKVTAHFDGRVERLYADFTGQYIRQGQRLATMYSPDLVTAQKELFEALKFKDSNPSFYEAAIQKLKLWELTESQIEAIVEKGEPQFYFDVHAPRSGTIMTRNVSKGEHVMDGSVLFEIANLNRLWVLFDAYESDLPWIRTGDSISFKVQSIPGQTFESVVTFIDPVVNKQTRTAAVRTEIRNIDNLLKPEMFVEGTVEAGLTMGEGAVLVPKSAILWTGKRAVAYVKRPNYSQPTFQFREVELGPDAGDYYVVNAGLEEDEEVAANGVFKIDAAAQLQGKTSMMNRQTASPMGGKSSTGHDHGGMEDHSGHDMSHPEVNISGDLYEVSAAFRDQLKTVFETYLPLKDALVETDASTAKEKAEPLLASINAVDMSLVKGDAHVEWMKDLNVLKTTAEMIVSESDVEKIRTTLSPLSDQLYETLVKFQVETGGFRQYCPMAFDFKGAFWLSNSDSVLNPYFGDEMLTCGNVEEELK
ncbi:MAG: efflux RND transporter periplasmic adaptor subunit [Cytophagales bacterium]|nr:efflux RND transporter periplasmic adaptor subunit [Cytophagales bacterium]